MFLFWLFLIIVIVGLLLLATAYIFSNTVVRGRRQPIVHTPKEYGMEFEDVYSWWHAQGDRSLQQLEFACRLVEGL